MYIAKRYAYVDAGMGNEDSEENALSMNFVSADENPHKPPTPPSISYLCLKYSILMHIELNNSNLH